MFRENISNLIKVKDGWLLILRSDNAKRFSNNFRFEDRSVMTVTSWRDV